MPTIVRASSIRVRIAPGELIDKITILEIKSVRIREPEKLRNVLAELATLAESRRESVATSPELEALSRDLRLVNETLWDAEDEIRDCEHAGDFGPRFVELARAIYRNNDRRAEIKRAINLVLRSDLIEEKSYA